MRVRKGRLIALVKNQLELAIGAQAEPVDVVLRCSPKSELSAVLWKIDIVFAVLVAGAPLGVYAVM